MINVWNLNTYVFSNKVKFGRYEKLAVLHVSYRRFKWISDLT